MDTTIENLKHLLFSGDKTMIELGFQLIESQQLMEHPYIQQLMEVLNMLKLSKYDNFSLQELLEEFVTKKMHLYLNFLEYKKVNIAYLLEHIGIVLEYVSVLIIEHFRYHPFIDSLYQYTQLKQLVIEIPKLERFPERIGLLSNLDFLVIKKSWIRTVPAEIAQLPKLVYFKVSSYLFVELPLSFKNHPTMSIFLEKYAIMKDIYKYNCIPEFRWFSNPCKITFENDYGGMEALAALFNECKAIEFSNCKLSALPPIIKKMPNLCKLSLKDLNRFSILPSWFYKLTKLTELEIDNCNIRYFKAELKQLINLREFYLVINYKWSQFKKIERLKKELTEWLPNAVIKIERF